MFKLKKTNLRLLVAQLVCAAVLVVEFIFDILDKRFAILTWQAHEILEYMEIASAAVLILITILVFRQNRKELRSSQKKVRSLTLDFSVLIAEILVESGLSKTEREIAWLNIKGYSNTEISELRTISESTVKKHQSSIYAKFQVNSRGAFLSEIFDKILDAKAE